MIVDDAGDVYAPLYEYTEEFANIKDGWIELLNTYGKEGWELDFVLIDELQNDGSKKPGSRRLIFKRLDGLNHVCNTDDEESDDEVDAEGPES